MTVYTWATATSGVWSAASNWSPAGGPPNETSADALIDVGGSYTVTLAAGAVDTVDSVTLAASGATLDIDGTLDFATGKSLSVGAGRLGLSGTVTGATVDGTGGVVAFRGGTLEGASWLGTLDLTAAFSTLSIADGIALRPTTGSGPGAIDLTGQGSTLTVITSTTLDHATIAIGGSSLLNVVTGGTLTLGADLTLQQSDNQAAFLGAFAGNTGFVTGDIVNLGTIRASGDFSVFTVTATAFHNQGSIAIDAASFADDATNFSNAGRIDVTNAGSLYLDGIWSNSGDITVSGATLGLGGTWSNTGDLTVTDSALAVGGSFTTAQLASLTLSNDTATFAGTLDNTGATLEIGSGHGLATVTLDDGSDIVGGVIEDPGDALRFVYLGDSATLDGVTYRGTLGLDAQQGLQLTIENGLTLQGVSGAGPGAITLTGVDNALVFATTTTLDNAAITIGNAAALILDAPGGTLTLGAHLIVQTANAGLNPGAGLGDNSGSAGGGIVNLGTIDANASGQGFGIAGGAFTNRGLIDVDGQGFGITTTRFTNTGTITVRDGGTLTLDGAVLPTGTVTVTDSTLNLYGTFTTAQLAADLAAIVLTDATIELSGTLENTGATLDVGSGTPLGTLELASSLSDIVGGVIADAGGGLLIDSATTLDGVTYWGPLNFPNGAVTIADGITLLGRGGTGRGVVNLTGSFSQLYVTTSTTLDNATINFGNAAYLFLGLGAGSLTLGPHLTVQQVGGGFADLNDDSGDTGIINLGSINASVAGEVFYVDGGSFSNRGVINVTSGDLDDTATNFSNAGTIEVTHGGTLSLADTWSNTGTITVNKSTLKLAGTFTTATLQAFDLIAATIDLAGTLDNTGATLAIGAGAGIATLSVAAGGGITGGTVELYGTFATAAFNALDLSDVAVNIHGTLMLGYATYAAIHATVAVGGRVDGLGTITEAVAVSGTIESHGGLLLLAGGASGPGTLQVDAGSKLELRANTRVGRFIDSGTLQLTGYQLSLTNTSTVSAAGRLAGVGWVTNIVANSGTIEASGPGQLTLAAGASGAGTLLVDAGSEMDLRGATAAKTLTDNGVLKLFGGTATITAASVSASGTAEGFGAFLGPLTDDGTVQARGGGLRLGAVGGAGALQIGNAATLELTAATSLDATFLNGAVGSLALDDPAGFTGRIAGLAVSDALIFKNEMVSSAVIGGGATLTVVGSAGTTSYRVAGAIASTHFTISPDGHVLTLAHV